jgi:pyruvate oxidase
MGAKGITVRTPEELTAAFDEAAKITTQPIVIDVKIEDYRPLPVEALQLDTDKFTAADIAAYSEKYQVHDLPALGQLLTKYEA